MSNHVNLSLPDGFDNNVRLFPLPSTVLFPGTVHALHLFEPRYRAMMDEAIETDELITMAYVNPETANAHVPEIAKEVCVGKLLSHTKLEDGRYNLFLIGAKRAKIVQEFTTDKLFRTAEVEIHSEPEDGGADIHFLRDEIVNSFRELVDRKTGWNHEALDQFLDKDLPFGLIADMICHSCGAAPEDQQRVLATFELRSRGEIVLELIQQQIEASRQYGNVDADAGQTFPPGFSSN